MQIAKTDIEGYKRCKQPKALMKAQLNRGHEQPKLLGFPFNFVAPKNSDLGA
jgi:hypothetical protein